MHNLAAQVVCSNGLPGFETADVCCPEECGQCGGIDCGDLPGGQENCCTGYIDENGDNCSDTNTAPCIVDDPACEVGLAGTQPDSVASIGSKVDLMIPVIFSVVTFYPSRECVLNTTGLAQLTVTFVEFR